VLGEGDLRPDKVRVVACREKRFFEPQQFFRYVLPQPGQRVIEPQRSMMPDSILDALDLVFQVAQPFRQAGDVACRLDSFDQFRPPAPLLLQVLRQRLQRAGRTLPRQLGEPLANLVFALFDRYIQNLRAENPLLEGIEQLFLQPVLSDQQLVAACPVMLMLVATILNVPTLSASGAYDHAAAAIPTNQIPAEDVSPPRPLVLVPPFL
jgi:hypothetical protein